MQPFGFSAASRRARGRLPLRWGCDCGVGCYNFLVFDDMFLNIPGWNVAIVDSFVTDQDYALLRQYIEIERTSTQQA